MPIDSGSGDFFDIGDVFGFLNAQFGVKIFLVLFLIFYTVFALIIFRQIQLMTNTLPTGISPFLKFIGIIHIGVALALLFAVIGLF